MHVCEERYNRFVINFTKFFFFAFSHLLAQTPNFNKFTFENIKNKKTRKKRRRQFALVLLLLTRVHTFIQEQEILAQRATYTQTKYCFYHMKMLCTFDLVIDKRKRKKKKINKLWHFVQIVKRSNFCRC